MTDRPLTLMAVHAHPDDEATGTGGVLARYAAEGIRVNAIAPGWVITMPLSTEIAPSVTITPSAEASEAAHPVSDRVATASTTRVVKPRMWPILWGRCGGGARR